MPDLADGVAATLVRLNHNDLYDIAHCLGAVADAFESNDRYVEERDAAAVTIAEILRDGRPERDAPEGDAPDGDAPNGGAP